MRGSHMTTDAPHRPLSEALCDYLIDWRRHPWPLDWSSVFGRSAPLALEIGYGNGEFLAAEAAQHRERDHVGVELSWGSATRLFKRLDRAGLDNVRAVSDDAEQLLGLAFAPGQLEEVSINHPCPWPKERHHRRRLIQPGFLALLASRLKPDGRAHLVTDHAELAQWVRERFAEQDALVEDPAAGEGYGHGPTKYQRQAMAQGIPIHFFHWRRAAAPDPARLPRFASADPETVMPSLTLNATAESPAASKGPLEGFTHLEHREHHQDVDVLCRLEGVYERNDPRVWWVETLVKENELRQDFGLLVVPRGEGFLIKLADVGRPHPTWGVKRAVALLGAWLLERHPGWKVTHESVGDDLASSLKTLSE